MFDRPTTLVADSSMKTKAYNRAAFPTIVHPRLFAARSLMAPPSYVHVRVERAVSERTKQARPYA